MQQTPINELTSEQKDNLVDELLVYMTNKLEKDGTPIKIGLFDFHLSSTESYWNAPDEIIPEGINLTEFKNSVSINDETFKSVINYCFTHQYVKNLCASKQKYDNILLTDEGFARATSVVKARYKKTVTDSTHNIHIGSINGNNIQIGNHNIQNIENTFQYLIDEINNAKATDEEKKNALDKLRAFLYNPIVSNILSAGTVEILKGLLGA